MQQIPSLSAASGGQQLAPSRGAHAAPAAAGIDRLVRLAEAKHLTGLGRTAIYAGMAAGTFPRNVLIGSRAVAWKHSELMAWVQARPAAPIRTTSEGA